MKVAPVFVMSAVLLTAAAPMAARASGVVVLKFGDPGPATSYVNTKGFTPWIDEVEKASDGTLKIKLYTGGMLVKSRDVYERTLAGVSQISYGVFGPLASQFPRIQVADLPILSNDARVSSIALWRLYADGLFAHEFARVKVLALFNFPSAVINTNKPIRSLDDLRGMKLAASSRISADVVEALGASPVTLTVPEIYTAMSRGVVNGVVTSLTAAKSFKLDEVTKDYLEVPLGESPAYVFMNRAAYARLPAKARQAIDEYSGEPFSQLLGANNEAAEQRVSKKIATEPDHSVTQLSPTRLALWKARIRPVIDAWIKRAPDGAKVLAAYREEIKKIGTGN